MHSTSSSLQFVHGAPCSVTLHLTFLARQHWHAFEALRLTDLPLLWPSMPTWAAFRLDGCISCASEREAEHSDMATHFWRFRPDGCVRDYEARRTGTRARMVQRRGMVKIMYRGPSFAMVDNRRVTMLRASQTPGELDVVDYPYMSNFAVGLVPGCAKDPSDLRSFWNLAGGLRGSMRQHNQHAWAGEITLRTPASKAFGSRSPGTSFALRSGCSKDVSSRSSSWESARAMCHQLSTRRAGRAGCHTS